jgi:hypothetical protein
MIEIVGTPDGHTRSDGRPSDPPSNESPANARLSAHGESRTRTGDTTIPEELVGVLREAICSDLTKGAEGSVPVVSGGSLWVQAMKRLLMA